MVRVNLSGSLSGYARRRGFFCGWATRRVLGGSPAPTALVHDNDVMAVAGLAAAADLGFRVPQDVSVVSWEDSALCRVVTPRLSALSRDGAEFGRTAARELMSLLDGRPGRAAGVPVPRLTRRGSTAAVRVDERAGQAS